MQCAGFLLSGVAAVALQQPDSDGNDKHRGVFTHLFAS
jgi:hypothetical protein